MQCVVRLQTDDVSGLSVAVKQVRMGASRDGIPTCAYAELRALQELQPHPNVVQVCVSACAAVCMPVCVCVHACVYVCLCSLHVSLFACGVRGAVCGVRCAVCGVLGVYLA